MCRAWTIVVVASWLLFGHGRAGAASEREPAKAAPPSAAATFVYKSPFPDFTPEPPLKSDPNRTLERCRKSSWAIPGCELSFPKQGREFAEKECGAPGHSVSADRNICWLLATYRVEGIGGPKEADKGMQMLTQLCDRDGDRPSCAQIALYIAAKDEARARDYFYRACSEEGKAPLELCIKANDRLNGANAKPAKKKK